MRSSPRALNRIPTVRETADLLAQLVSDIKAEATREYTKEEWFAARNKYVLENGHARANLKCGLYIETKRPGWYRSLGLPVSFSNVPVCACEYVCGVVSTACVRHCVILIPTLSSKNAS